MKRFVVSVFLALAGLCFLRAEAQVQSLTGFSADKGAISDFSLRGGFRIPSRAFKPSIPKRQKNPTRDASQERHQEEKARDLGEAGFFRGLFAAFRSWSLLGLLLCLASLYVFLRKVYNPR